MDFELNDDQLELQQTVRDVLDREAPTSLARSIAEQTGSTTELWTTLVGLDWPALTLPESVGGLDLGWVELVILLEEMGRHVAPGPFQATVSQFVPAVHHAGTAAQKERFLGPVASSGATGTLAIDEGSGTWDLESVKTSASWDGDFVVLTGTKCFVVDGSTAEEIAVVVHLDDELRVVVVPGDSVDPQELAPIDATTRHATIEFDGVRVDSDRLLGTGDATAAVSRAVQEATLGVAASTLGACQRILELNLAHVKERRQFDVPIGSFQAVKHKLANMYCLIERARALVYYAALVLTEGDDRGALATSMAKAGAGECQHVCVRDGLQLFGGIGYTWEHDLHLFLRRAKVGELHYGTSPNHRCRVAELQLAEL
ncbi:MAG: acyl-CoA dehydrogenase family protein [Actinomycetota bacterium]|nr:acyl-CoA dehydrogenase family protein [Actinomycetota bacterium]